MNGWCRIWCSGREREIFYLTIEDAGVTGNVRVNVGDLVSHNGSKRMIDLIIIVLRAVVALSKAVIALLELIRHLVE